MRITAILTLALLIAPTAFAKGPTTRPFAQDKVELELLGPVRLANYTQPFAPPKGDPFMTDRNRHTYNVPACYSYWGGCYGYYGGWYGGWYGGGCYSGPYIYGGGVSPSGMFYGD